MWKCLYCCSVSATRRLEPLWEEMLILKSNGYKMSVISFSKETSMKQLMEELLVFFLFLKLLMSALWCLTRGRSRFFLQAINLLPANTQIREIRVFLESVLEEKAQRKRCNQVLKSLLQAEFLRVSFCMRSTLFKLDYTFSLLLLWLIHGPCQRKFPRKEKWFHVVLVGTDSCALTMTLIKYSGALYMPRREVFIGFLLQRSREDGSATKPDRFISTSLQLSGRFTDGWNLKQAPQFERQALRTT